MGFDGEPANEQESTDFIKKMTKHAKSYNEFAQLNTLDQQAPYTCANRDPADLDGTVALAWAPVLAGVVKKDSPKVDNYQGTCFDSISWEYEQVSDTSVNVIINTENPKSQSC